MKTTVDYKPAVQFVREFAHAKARAKGFSCAHVFNDRLKSGGRSIKVWLKDRQYYTPIKRRLEKMGYTVKLKNLGRNRYSDNKDCYRIHVR
jgi:hypothetical protein